MKNNGLRGKSRIHKASFSKDRQPTFEERSEGQLRRNYRNDILKSVMGRKVSDVCTPAEIKRLVAIHSTKFPSEFMMGEATVEEIIVQNLSRYCINNGEALCSNNALQVIKHLCSHTLEDFAEQLQMNLTISSDENNI